MIDYHVLNKLLISHEDYIIKILEGLGCHSFNYKNTTIGKELRFALPEHNNSTSGVLKLDTLYCKSYTPDIDYSGSLIGLVKYIKKISMEESVVWICHITGINIEALEPMFPELSLQNSISDFIIQVAKRIRKPYDISELQSFGLDNEKYIFKPHKLLFEEGIGIKVQEKFKIGYDLWSKRILFPHRKWNGDGEDFVGIIGRTTNPFWEILGIPKYFPLKSYLKRKNLYGLWENLRERKPDNLSELQDYTYRTIKDNHYIVIYEAEKSVLKRATWNDYTGVAIMGHELQMEQVQIIDQLDDVWEVVFALDKDVPEEKVLKMCKMIKSKKVSYIIDDKGVLGPTDSPADAPTYFWDLFLHRKKFEG